MSARSVLIPQPSPSHAGAGTAPRARTSIRDVAATLIEGLKRRWSRERRRRAVGRAYDMAMEIARVVPTRPSVLDVGCGNGFIAHHLSAMLATPVIGTDLMSTTKAPIAYRRYDGNRFPACDSQFDVVLLCYVLHHAQDSSLIMSEVRRVLRVGGLAVVYEDIPRSWWDRAVCFSHNLQWRSRTGRCTFRLPAEWRTLFEAAGFEIMTERSLSRWRNLTHPVSRTFYLLRLRSTLTAKAA